MVRAWTAGCARGLFLRSGCAGATTPRCYLPQHSTRAGVGDAGLRLKLSAAPPLSLQPPHGLGVFYCTCFRASAGWTQLHAQQTTASKNSFAACDNHSLQHLALFLEPGGISTTYDLSISCAPYFMTFVFLGGALLQARCLFILLHCGTCLRYMILTAILSTPLCLKRTGGISFGTLKHNIFAT